MVRACIEMCAGVCASLRVKTGLANAAPWVRATAELPTPWKQLHGHHCVTYTTLGQFVADTRKHKLDLRPVRTTAKALDKSSLA